MVVAFTGYRSEKMPFQESKKDKRYLAFRTILSRVISRLIELGGTYFISGVARGFDTEDGRKRPAPVMRKESGNVFKEQKARSFNAGNPSDFKEQRSSGIFKAPSLSSD